MDFEELSPDLGGVGLAKRCAIKIKGTAKKGGKCDADLFNDLIRYENMRELTEEEVKSSMEKSGCALICNGWGKELYYLPDGAVRVEDKVIKLCPDEAAKDALASSSRVSAADAKSVVINFLGGNDLVYGEVKEACDMLVETLDISDNAKIRFNSVCYKDFEEGTCSVTVVAVDGQVAGVEGIEESIARGEVYAYQGKWYTLVKDDITTAIE